jgi:hypothetical protein
LRHSGSKKYTAIDYRPPAHGGGTTIELDAP